MAENYIYFSSSLPRIEFDGKLPFTVKTFLEDCLRFMKDRDYILLKNVLSDRIESSSHNKTIQKWMDFNQSLRNTIVQYRARKFEKNAEDYFKGDFVSEDFFNNIVDQATQADDPLRGEKVIDQARWDFLAEIAFQQFFDFDYLITYAVRLQILEKYEYIQSPKGAEVFAELKQMDLSDKF